MFLRRLAGLFYGLSAFGIALSIWAYFLVFMGNLRYPANPWVTPSVDVGSSVGGWQAVLINISLLSLFGLQHSVMSRVHVKNAIAKIVPQDLERSTYVHAANLAMILLLLFWQPIPVQLWAFDHNIIADMLWGIFALGFLIILWAVTSIDLLELWGVRQAWSWFKGQPYQELPMKTHWLYEQVRHPQYLGILLAIWFSPYMTVGHILFATGFTVYIWVGLKYEERDLVRRYGDGYKEYQQRVPALFPRFLIRSGAITKS